MSCSGSSEKESHIKKPEQDNKNENKAIKEILLANDIGMVRIALNPEFDSYKESRSQSDYGCCGSQLLYSFKDTNNDNLILADSTSSFYGVEVSDSLKVLSFSISHSACKNCNPKDFKIDEEYLKLQEKRLLTENVLTQIKVKEMKMINGQLFSIIGNAIIHPNFVIENIEANTIFKGETISFFGQRLNQDSSQFIDDMYRMIQTIEIIE